MALCSDQIRSEDIAEEMLDLQLERHHEMLTEIGSTLKGTVYIYIALKLNDGREPCESEHMHVILAVIDVEWGWHNGAVPPERWVCRILIYRKGSTRQWVKRNAHGNHR